MTTAIIMAATLMLDSVWLMVISAKICCGYEVS